MLRTQVRSRLASSILNRILNHFFIHLLDVSLEEALDHLPLQLEGCRHQTRLWGPGLRDQSHHFGDLELLKVGFYSVNIYAFDNSLKDGDS